MQPYEKISAARDALADLLQGEPLFAREGLPVPVITEKKGDIETQIAEAIAKLGLCAIVVAADAGARQAAGQLALVVNLVVQITEDVLMNSAAAKEAGVAPVSALDLAAAALLAIHRGPRLVLDDTPLSLVPDAPAATYQIRCHTLIRL
jgi:hypothetical protein